MSMYMYVHVCLTILAVCINDCRMTGACWRAHGRENFIFFLPQGLAIGVFSSLYAWTAFAYACIYNVGVNVYAIYHK